MHIVRFNTLQELQPYSQGWDHLAACVPFRGWTWLSTWWRHYGEDTGGNRRDLFVLAVFDEGDMLVGLAPWYLESSIAFGAVVKMLGSGQVCSDYLTLLAHRGMEEDVSELVAEYLTDALPELHGDVRPWDRLELTGVDFDDRPTEYLAESLRHRNCTIHRRSTVNCWRIDLPTRWEDYLASVSKKLRQEIRRMERRYFDAGRTEMRGIEKTTDLPGALDVLIDLHQRRWRSRGEPGCYASPQFTNFIREVSPLLMPLGQMQLQRLELDGRVVAAEYQLIGGGIVYAYQTAIEPEAIADQPGKLLNVASIRRSIEGGYRGYDFMRGDEPYKAHFRATARPSMEIRVVPDRAGPLIRHKLWLTGSRVKRWLKSGLKAAAR
jgi:CelD/BcsL family acetyltransferase involved in cellulose biosynthesis